MSDLRWYEVHGWDQDPLLALRVVGSSGQRVHMGWLVATDDGWEYVHGSQEINDVVDLPGITQCEAKKVAETMVRLRCTLNRGLPNIVFEDSFKLYRS